MEPAVFYIRDKSGQPVGSLAIEVGKELCMITGAVCSKSDIFSKDTSWIKLRGRMSGKPSRKNHRKLFSRAEVDTKELFWVIHDLVLLHPTRGQHVRDAIKASEERWTKFHTFLFTPKVAV